VLAHARWKLPKRFEINNQIVFDSKHGVCRQPWVVLWIDLRNNCLVIAVCNLYIVRYSSSNLTWKELTIK
jgi:hypothetical protein